MKRFNASLVMALAIAAIVGSCTREKIVTPATHKAQVSGTVSVWRCGIDDCLNNSGDVRYTVQTGRPATVKFARTDNCCTLTGLTDDSSIYQINIEPGDYFAILETPYAHPDTLFGIDVTKDTAIDFDFVYEYLTPDSIEIGFFYPDSLDTLAEAVERAAITDFDFYIGHMLNLGNVERQVWHSQYSPFATVDYRVPTKAEYAPWQVEDASYMVFTVYGDNLPPNMEIHTDVYICMFRAPLQEIGRNDAAAKE